MISWAERRGIVRCGGMLSDKDDPRQQRREVAPGNLGNGRTWTFLFPSQTDSQVEVPSQRPLDSETLPAQASRRHSTCRDNLVSTVSSIAASTTHQSKRPYLTSN